MKVHVIFRTGSRGKEVKRLTLEEKEQLQAMLDKHGGKQEKKRSPIWSAIGAFGLAGMCSGVVAFSMFTFTMAPLLNSHPVFSSALTLAVIACGAYAGGRWGWGLGKKAAKLGLICCAIFALIPYLFVFYVVMFSVATISLGEWID